jgi:hypothetical protein
VRPLPLPQYGDARSLENDIIYGYGTH